MTFAPQKLFAIQRFEAKIQTILLTVLPVKVAAYNLTVPESLRLPNYIPIDLGPPTDQFESSENTLATGPRLILTHQSSQFTLTDSIQVRNELALYRIVAYYPDLQGMTNGFMLARTLARIAFEAIEQYAVDPPDDVNAICVRTDLTDQQAYRRQNGGSLSTLGFRAHLRSRYELNPMGSILPSAELPILALEYIVAQTALISVGVSSTLPDAVSYPSFAPVSFTFSGTLPTIKVWNAGGQALIRADQGEAIGFTVSAPAVNIDLSSIQPRFDSINTTGKIDLFISIWESSGESFTPIQIGIIKGA